MYDELKYFWHGVLTGVLDIIMMYGAYSTTHHMAISRIFLRFIWFASASAAITFLYL